MAGSAPQTYASATSVPDGVNRLRDAEGGEWRSAPGGAWLPVDGWPEALTLAELIDRFGPVTPIDDERGSR